MLNVKNGFFILAKKLSCIVQIDVQYEKPQEIAGQGLGKDNLNNIKRYLQKTENVLTNIM